MTTRRSNRRLYPGQRDVEDWRDDAQTDRDRIWYSYEFRRLGGVTQVVPPQDDHLFHDRLTHSVKVAQVAETIARRLRYKANLDNWDETTGLTLHEWIDPMYCMVAALAHDIGHPPFGHAGEAHLQKYFAKNGNGYVRERSFEGNAQSTRIVSSLSFRKDHQQPGLNPTLRSVAAIAKYPWRRGRHPHAVTKLRKKWSFYAEEAWILDLLVEEGFVAIETSIVTDEEGRPRLDRNRQEIVVVDAVHRWPEAEIMDWADDISYAVHDLEDFFRAGRIPLHDFSEFFLRADDDMAWGETDFTSVTHDREIREAADFARSRMLALRDRFGEPFPPELTAGAFDWIKRQYQKHIPTTSFDGTRLSHIRLQKFASLLITDLIDAAEIEILEVAGDRRVQVSVAANMQLVAEFFKSLCHFFVIQTSTLATLQRGQARSLDHLVSGLYTAALEWMLDARNDRSLPARLREYIRDAVPREDEDADDEELRGVVQVAVVDYICSLRDQQAALLTARLTGQQPVAWSGQWIDG